MGMFSKKIGKTITLSLCAAGAIALTPATFGLTGIAGALTAFGANFFADHARRRLNDMIARINEKAASGELPPNHDIERAAQEAYCDTLLILAEHLEKSGNLDKIGKKWLNALCSGLKKAKDTPPADWPDFSTDDPADFIKYWEGQAAGKAEDTIFGEVFADKLCNTTKAWFDTFATATKTTTPPAVTAAADHGWSTNDKHHTLASIWTECFRFQIKHSAPAANALLFDTLAQLADNQQTIQTQLHDIAQKLHARDEHILAELARIPAMEDLKNFNERLTKLTDRLEAEINRFGANNDRFEDNLAMMKQLLEKMAMQPQQPSEKSLTPEERLEQAKADLAKEHKISVEALEKMLKHISADIEADPNADPLDKARSAYTELRLSDGIDEARKARELAEEDVEDIEELEVKLREKKRKRLERFFESTKVEGQGLYLAEKFGEAVNLYRNALRKILRADMPDQWANLQFLLGKAANRWASRSKGDAICQHRQLAIAAYRLALEVCTREEFPQVWGMIQHYLGNALHHHAFASNGEDRVRLYSESVQVYRLALEVYTRKEFPQGWAMIQSNLGDTLCAQALESEDKDRIRLQSEAVQAYRLALEVYTRKEFPEDWALTQECLGLSLRDQAEASEGEDRVRLLSESVQAYRFALEVYTREEFPLRWATTQNDLGATLCDQALASDDKDQVRLLSESVQAYCLALEVYTRKESPQDWAEAQYHLGMALGCQAWTSEGKDRIRLFQEAISRLEMSLDVYTQEYFPVHYQRTQDKLSITRGLLDEAQNQ